MSFSGCLFFRLVGNHDAVDNVEIVHVFVPRFGHHVQNLTAGVLGGGAHRIAHAPGEAAGDGLPFVRAVLRVEWAGDADRFVGHAQRCRGHLRRRRERTLSDFLTANAQGRRAVFIHFEPGAGTGVGRHGGRFPRQGNAFAAPLVGRTGGRFLAPVNGAWPSCRCIPPGRSDACVMPVTRVSPPLHAVELVEIDFVHADCLSQFVHALVDRRMQFRHAKAAIRAADRVVGVDAQAVRFDIGDVVGAGAAVAAGAGDVDAIFGRGAAIPIHRVFHGQ